MPLYEGELADGTRFQGFICGPRLTPKRCYLCDQLGVRQCDYLIAPPTKRRCNRHLCLKHFTALTANKDACPEHAERCLAALARLAERKPHTGSMADGGRPYMDAY
jgi:hypothetical protein